MNRKRKMNGEAAAIRSNVIPGAFVSQTDEPDQLARPSWWRYILTSIGVLEMAPSTKPPGLTINITNATFIVLILGSILGGFWWSYQRGENAGVEKGRQEAEKQHLQVELDAIRKELFVVKEKQKIIDDDGENK